jgi:hypothetical protein
MGPYRTLFWLLAMGILPMVSAFSARSGLLTRVGRPASALAVLKPNADATDGKDRFLPTKPIVEFSLMWEVFNQQLFCKCLPLSMFVVHSQRGSGWGFAVAFSVIVLLIPSHTLTIRMLCNSNSTDSRLAYTYDYYLGGTKDKGGGKGVNKSVLQILEEAKPVLKQKLEDLRLGESEETDKVEKVLTKAEKVLADEEKGREAAIKANLPFMKTVLGFPNSWPGGHNNKLMTFDNDHQDNKCLYGVWQDT